MSREPPLYHDSTNHLRESRRVEVRVRIPAREIDVPQTCEMAEGDDC
jgi:hypothetical protein